MKSSITRRWHRWPSWHKKNSTDDKEDRSNYADRQRRIAGKVGDSIERYDTHNKEDSDYDHGFNIGRHSDFEDEE